MKKKYLLIILITFLSGCSGTDTKTKRTVTTNTSDVSMYKGTASITQGLATTTAENIFSCDRGRKTEVGEIKSLDGKKWIVPANANVQNDDIPFAPDLHNTRNGTT